MKRHEERSPSSFEADSKSKGSHEQESKTSDPEYKSDSCDDTFSPCIREMLREAAATRDSLFEEGFIGKGGLWFLMLQRVEYSIIAESKDDPDYVKKNYEDYFKFVNNLYDEIYETLYKGPPGVDKERMDRIVEQLKRLNDERRVGGTRTMTEVDNIFRASEKGDIDGIKSAFKQAKIETENLRKKLAAYLELHKRLQEAMLTFIPKVQSEAAAIRDSLAKEGFNQIWLTFLRDFPNLQHGEYADHCKIVDGLFSVINETLHEEPTGDEKIKIKIFDLMKRLERKLEWIGGHKIKMELREMLQAYYKDDMKGILYALEKVKIENKNLRNNVDAYFKLVDVDRPWRGGDEACIRYFSMLKQECESSQQQS